MHKILTIAGSPSQNSRSSSVLELSRLILEKQGLDVSCLSVKDIPPEDLVYANFESASLKKAQNMIEQAQAIIVGTPVYKASYTGVLKALLDLMPQYAFSGKTVLPIATGGTITHLLSIDYAMKPLFSVLGATHILRGIFILDSQMQRGEGGQLTLDDDIEIRLKDSLTELASFITC
ncbi:NADPH-dependent FMN reductase [Leptolyngbya sp. KIOST-1]|uniref:NADPH-dependent FMN reductase n=1 Tax=Leptolyngbya sp. KIOST-1 TaxID=1229172 RepID=UPI0009079F8E|nr:NADPH-dependent FMN reductase [Leptolyngbya sp. KIOST-1]